jgi:FixJ family two-component response regulator
MGDGLKNILFIDNQAGGPTCEEKALAAAGYLVKTARPGPKTLQVALQQSPDLIILSLSYGDHQDAYVFRQIIERDEFLGKPIILLTARANAVRVLYRDVKAVVEVLGRPCPNGVLSAAVERALGRIPRPQGDEEHSSLLDEEILRLTGRGPPGASAGESLQRKISRTLASRLGEAIRQGFHATTSPGRESTAIAIARKILGPDDLDSLGRELCRLIGDVCSEGFRVSGKYFGLSDVVQCLSTSRQTGLLVVQGAGSNQVEVSLLDGVICFLNPRQIHLRHCQENVCLPRFSFPTVYVEEVLKRGAAPDDSLLFHILQDGKVQSEQFRDLMISLGLEVLQECIFDQETSWFEFRPQKKLGGRFLEHNAKLPGQKLLIKLSARLDEWKAVPEEAEVRKVRFLADPHASSAGLLEASDDQAMLIAVQEAPRTIAELSSLTQLSPIQVWRSLDRLQKAGLVRKLEDQQKSSVHSEASAKT